MAAGEECDDLESWEEMEDSGVLDKKIEKLKAAMSTSLQKDLRSGGSGKNDTVVFLAEDGRTRYVPPEPTVKILKRPPVLNSPHNAGGDGFIINGDGSGKPKQPIKTLQQRELEYAEARLRILGEAQSPEEKPALLERIRRIQNKTELVQETVEQSSVAPPLCGPCFSVFSPSSLNQIASPLNNTGPVVPPQPMIIMTSTSTHLSPMLSSQAHLTATNNCVGGMGQYGVIANSSSAAFNNGCAQNLQIGNQFAAVGYGTGNKSGVYNNIVHNSSDHHQNSYAAAYGICNNSSPAVAFAGAGMIDSSVMSSPVGNSFVTVQAPMSLNLAIRQPRGPDGTKGFNNYRTTLR